MPEYQHFTKSKRESNDRGERTRREIMSAALDAFADAGYKGMSVRELCRDLGVSHNIVNHHFGTKWDLWCASVKFGFADAVEVAVEQYDAEEEGMQDPVETVRTIVTSAVMLAAEHPSLLRIFADEGSRDSERLDFLLETQWPGIAPLDRFMDDTRFEGAPKLDRQLISFYLLTCVPAIFNQRALAEKLLSRDPGSDAVVRRWASLVSDLIVAGLFGTVDTCRDHGSVAGTKNGPGDAESPV